MAHRVLTDPRGYEPFEDFRDLVWQIRFCLNAETFELLEEYLGGFVHNVLMRTLDQWNEALVQVALAERMAMTYEEYAAEYEAMMATSSEDEGDGDFVPTDFGW